MAASEVWYAFLMGHFGEPHNCPLRVA